MSIMGNAQYCQENQKCSYEKYSYFQSDGIYLQSLVQFFQSLLYSHIEVYT